TLQNRMVSGGRLNVARALDIIGIDGPVVRRFEPGPVTGRTDPSTGLPINTITAEFNKSIDASVLAADSASILYAGPDGIFGTPDDSTVITVASVSIDPADDKIIHVALDLSNVPQQRLLLGRYRLTLHAGTAGDPKIRDLLGNLLKGDSTGGSDEVYVFEVVGIGGSLEPNDTLATATPVVFNASGKANFNGVFLGDGLHAGLDVDIFRITMPRGGLITARVDAKSLSIPSQFDSYLRLFDALGNQIAANDQFNGPDAYLDYFVSTGGTYYVGVSGFPNSSYDPTVAGSGVSQSNGVYSLALGIELVGEDRITISDTLDQPLAVPPTGTQGTTSDSITVSDARAIRDVNLRIDLDHTFVSDLRISLISPRGTEVVVFDRHGTNGQDFNNVLFDDEASRNIVNAATPYSGSYRPTNPLNRFDGESAAGLWTIVINDTTALNAGVLRSWAIELTLENDIFGPFELNDTLTTARDLNEINGFGVAARTAYIGDGGFGLLDRDLFRFRADAGTTLNAVATSVADPVTGTLTLNTALRLFDASGVEIKRSSDDGTLGSTIGGFVFAAGGTYYIAVSEASNLDYDPFNVTSGTPAATTGRYTLTVSVSGGVSDSSHVLAGQRVRAGISNDGTFGANDSGSPLGIRFDGLDFLRSQASGAGLTSFYGLSAGGYEFVNNGSSAPTTLPMTLVSQSDASNQRTSVQGLFRQNLGVERTVSFGPLDPFIAIDVRLTNNGNSAITDVSWMEALNPNQGLNLDNRGPNTQNDVIDGAPYMRASVVTNAFEQGITIAMGAPASDSRAMATFIDPNAVLIRDPGQVLDFGVNDPNGASANLLMVLAYDIGTIGAGQSTTLRYFIFFGTSPAAAQGLYDTLNAGAGAGHLTVDTASPAVETLSDGSLAPTLPYRAYYPEGFASPFIYTFVPMLNPHDQPTRVFAIARYETGQRDQILADFVIAPQSRGGITLNTPEMYDVGFGNPGGSLVRPLEPYAIEIRSERPIAATFSHYDTFLLDGMRAAVGESFVSETSQTWTIGEVEKADGIFDIIIFQNVSSTTIKVETTLLPTGGGNTIRLTQELAPFRRGGWNLSAAANIPNGRYGVLIEAQAPIVAAVSSYDNGITTDVPGAKGFAATPGLGATSGVTPEGQFGINAQEERVGIANPNDADVTVVFSFLFENGSAYRTALDIPGLSRGEINVQSLPGFPQGRAYSILFDAPLPVSLSLPTAVFSDANGTTFATQSHTYWAFGEGFRPQDPYDTNVVEYLRLFNPTQQDQVVEITIRFDGNFTGTNTPLGQEVFRRVLPARRVTEFDVHDFVTGDRRTQDVFYGLTIKSPSGIVAYMGHFDSFFPGAFGTLGVPLGITGTI
ncbi:MAG: proprotein convertase P-domain-containing protein, partial [Phycisphaeraceae bacterium]|nr:proprotein convertase P-domain-containing protein [Phycisphaeraceae bacterium]